MPQKQKATVVIFRPSASAEKIELIMELMFIWGLTDDKPRVRDFNPDHGEPVFYIP